MNLAVSKVNSLDFEQFTATFGNVVELCPIIAAAAWSDSPFRNADHLQSTLEQCIDALPTEGTAQSHTHTTVTLCVTVTESVTHHSQSHTPAHITFSDSDSQSQSHGVTHCLCLSHNSQPFLYLTY